MYDNIQLTYYNTKLAAFEAKAQCERTNATLVSANDNQVLTVLTTILMFKNLDSVKTWQEKVWALSETQSKLSSPTKLFTPSLLTLKSDNILSNTTKNRSIELLISQNWTSETKLSFVCLEGKCDLTLKICEVYIKTNFY